VLKELEEENENENEDEIDWLDLAVKKEPSAPKIEALPLKKTFTIGKKMQSIDDEVVGVHRKKFEVPE
jgi:hypothetical protein